MRGYKVVKYDLVKGTYVSATSNGRILDYIIGSKTIPQDGDGPLAVFDNLISASRFKDNLFSRKDIDILECEYEVTNKEAALWFMKDFWLASDVGKVKGKAKLKNHGMFYLPEGTVFASSVILLEKVNLSGEDNESTTAV